MLFLMFLLSSKMAILVFISMLYYFLFLADICPHFTDVNDYFSTLSRSAHDDQFTLKILGTYMHIFNSVSVTLHLIISLRRRLYMESDSIVRDREPEALGQHFHAHI